MERVEVAVIGAGVAGLAAARELRRKSYDVRVFEARSRIGGRIFTRRDARLPIPIEMGAEFIHGEAPETHRILREAGLLAYDISGEHWQATRGHFRRPEFWKGINRVLGRIDPEAPDRSLSEFLSENPGGRSLALARAAARGFVQGFYAADPDRVSARSLAPENGEPASGLASRGGRVVGGYDRIPRWLAGELGGRVRLGARAVEISWEPGDCEVVFQSHSGRTSRIRARAVVITVPLGILQAPAGSPHGLAIQPDPKPIRNALNLLGMGSAVLLSVWFRDWPWDRKRTDESAKLQRLSFLHTPSGPFNVWWTAYPLRWPLAVAWCGGPRAAELARGGRSALLEAALRGLARSLGVSRRRVESEVLGSWFHDWDRDPFTRGAYSYIRVGGGGAARTLSRPVEGTLYFAGEAIDLRGQYGTVEGALASGLRAARQIDKALAKG